MDRNFYDNDDFEDFLKQKGDQYKMYPSERVWNNIHSSLHGRRNWLVGLFTLLFIGSALIVAKQAVQKNYTRLTGQLHTMPLSEDSILSLQERLQPFITKASPSPTTAASTGQETAPSSIKPIAKVVQLPILRAVTSSHAYVANPFSNEPATIMHPGTEQWQIGDDLQTEPALTALIVKPSVAAPADAKAAKQTLPPQLATTKTASSVKNYKASPWSIQIFASPVTSYRRLSIADEPGGYMTPIAAGNVNDFVHHKPALGFEVGSAIQYKLSDNLRIYVGAQLNYSRYYIDAFKYKTERASIALDNANPRDSVLDYTNIRNFSGYAPEQLQNQYWQLSIPVGMEIKLLGGKKLQLNVAGGIQPTFIINSNSYLISTNYKNYIQSPDLARSFNVHTNFEAFVSYQTGKIRWQLGPQFRSQLLSSYSNQYRVREYLTEYGIKFGFTKSLH